MTGYPSESHNTDSDRSPGTTMKVNLTGTEVVTKMASTIAAKQGQPTESIKPGVTDLPQKAKPTAETNTTGGVVWMTEKSNQGTTK